MKNIFNIQLVAYLDNNADFSKVKEELSSYLKDNFLSAVHVFEARIENEPGLCVEYHGEIKDSTHLSCNFDRTKWMPLLRQLMGKFQGAADGTVNDMIIDTNRQWECYGIGEYTPQEREALQQNWVECKTNGRIRPPGIIGREYRDGGYVPTVKVFEG